jgi:hypothetical protein
MGLRNNNRDRVLPEPSRHLGETRANMKISPADRLRRYQSSAQTRSGVIESCVSAFVAHGQSVPPQQ